MLTNENWCGKTWAKYDGLISIIGAAREVCVQASDFKFIHRIDTVAGGGMLLLARFPDMAGGEAPPDGVNGFDSATVEVPGRRT
jgi:hypothetical protein